MGKVRTVDEISWEPREKQGWLAYTVFVLSNRWMSLYDRFKYKIILELKGAYNCYIKHENFLKRKRNVEVLY